MMMTSIQIAKQPYALILSQLLHKYVKVSSAPGSLSTYSNSMRRMNDNDQGNEQGDFGDDDDVYVQLFFCKKLKCTFVISV